MKPLELSCHEFRLHNDFADSLVTRGLSPLPVCVLDNERLNFIDDSNQHSPLYGNTRNF